MEKEKKYRYLIIAEIRNKGYLLKFMSDLKEADKYAKEIFELSNEYSIYEQYKIETKLTYFASYHVNGTEVYIGNGCCGQSNGVYTVGTMKVDINNFRLNSFIRERENHSTVFPREDQWDQVDKFLKLFPSPNWIAN